MEHYEVAVIGAGPAGCMAAKYAAKAGARTVILEDHPAVGWPVECAGLLGWRAMEESELFQKSHILQGFKGAAVFSPGGHRVDFKASLYKAWAVDRRLFDRALALQALREGAELKLCSSVRGLNREKDLSILEMGDRRKIAAKVVISAEGIRARLAHKSGILPPLKMLSGAQVEAPYYIEDPENVEVHMGFSGLFAWVIPIGDSTARIGLCVKERACQYLQAFLATDYIKDRLLGSPGALVVGGLPLGPPPFTSAEGLLAVGDAAGQVKPISGGGIYPSLICAKLAGSIAADSALEGDSSAERLMQYDKSWRALIGRELEIGMRVNEMLSRMDHGEMDEVVCYLKEKTGLLGVIEKYGDIDQPSIIMAKILTHLGLKGIKLARLLRYALH